MEDEIIKKRVEQVVASIGEVLDRAGPFVADMEDIILLRVLFRNQPDEGGISMKSLTFAQMAHQFLTLDWRDQPDLDPDDEEYVEPEGTFEQRLLQLMADVRDQQFMVDFMLGLDDNGSGTTTA